MKEEKEEKKSYYELNKEKIKLKQKQYYEENKAILNKKRNNYKRTNNIDIDKSKKQKKEYYQNNKEKIKLKTKLSLNIRLSSDPLFRLNHYLRNAIRYSLKKSGFKKLSKTELILGCSFEEFNKYIESKFEPWMTWDNYGNPKDGVLGLNKTWDIDHVIPTSSGKTEKELLSLNHYTNLQPLCSYNNRFIKRDN